MITMTDQLKKQLQALLEQHPELNGAKLSLTGTEVIFTPAKHIPGEVITKATTNSPKKLIDTITGHSPKIEIRKSPIHGYGVFAKEIIEANELLEETRLLKLGHRSNYNHDPVLKDYVWAGKDDSEQSQLHGNTQYLALGFGSLYNHSDAPNTIQDLNFETEIITIKARQPIQKDEEIFISYGKKYFMIRNFWKNIKENNELESFIAKKNNNE